MTEGQGCMSERLEEVKPRRRSASSITVATVHDHDAPFFLSITTANEPAMIVTGSTHFGIRFFGMTTSGKGGGKTRIGPGPTGTKLSVQGMCASAWGGAIVTGSDGGTTMEIVGGGAIAIVGAGVVSCSSAGTTMTGGGSIAVGGPRGIAFSQACSGAGASQGSGGDRTGSGIATRISGGGAMVVGTPASGIREGGGYSTGLGGSGSMGAKTGGGGAGGARIIGSGEIATSGGGAAGAGTSVICGTGSGGRTAIIGGGEIPTSGRGSAVLRGMSGGLATVAIAVALNPNPDILRTIMASSCCPRLLRRIGNRSVSDEKTIR